MSHFPKVEEDQLQLLSFTPPLGRLPPRSQRVRLGGVRAYALLKWPPLPVPYEQKNALTLQRSSFRENPTYFLTPVRRWVCELVFDAIYDWRSEFSHNRQNEKALKCKPSALIFGRGRAKELLHVRNTLQLRKRTR